jgi:hypothetical protein
MRENFLVSSAEIAQLLVMNRANMTMQVGPAETGVVAVAIRAVIPQEKDGIANNVLTGISNPDIIIRASDFGVGIVFVSLFCIVRENDKRSRSLRSNMSAIHL